MSHPFHSFQIVDNVTHHVRKFIGTKYIETRLVVVIEGVPDTRDWSESFEKSTQFLFALVLWDSAHNAIHVPRVRVVPQPIDGRGIGANIAKLNGQRRLHVCHSFGIARNTRSVRVAVTETMLMLIDLEKNVRPVFVGKYKVDTAEFPVIRRVGALEINPMFALEVSRWRQRVAGRPFCPSVQQKCGPYTFLLLLTTLTIDVVVHRFQVLREVAVLLEFLVALVAWKPCDANVVLVREVFREVAVSLEFLVAFVAWKPCDANVVLEREVSREVGLVWV